MITSIYFFFVVYLQLYSAVNFEVGNQEKEDGLKNGSLLDDQVLVTNDVNKIGHYNGIPFIDCDDFPEKPGNYHSPAHLQQINQTDGHTNGLNKSRISQLFGKEHDVQESKCNISQLSQNFCNKNMTDANSKEINTIHEHDGHLQNLNARKRYVTLLNKDIKFHLVSKTFDRNSIYKRCNNPRKNEIYEVLPVFDTKLGVHFRNIYCTEATYMYQLEMIWFWDVIITKQCFMSEIKQVNAARYVDFLNRIIQSDSCSVILMPPSDVNASGLLVSHRGMTCSLTLERACKNNVLSQNKCNLSHLCQLCSWKKNSCMCRDGCVSDQEKEYLLLASPAANGMIIAPIERICIKNNCYKDNCKAGQLGQARKCVEVIKLLSGKILSLWVKTVFNVHKTSGKMNGILQSKLNEILQNSSETVFIKITLVSPPSENKESGCHIIRVLLYTWSFLTHDQFVLIREHFVTHVRDTITLLRNGTSGSNVIVSQMALRCEQNINSLFSIASTEKDTLVYILIGTSFAVTVSFILIAAVINWIQNICSQAIVQNSDRNIVSSEWLTENGP